MRLQGKVAIVTGGGTGIGEAICHKFAKEGAAVVVCGLPDDPVQDVAEAITRAGGQAIAHAGDISLWDAAQECVQLAVEHFGRLDILVNNAGTFTTTSTLDQYPLADFTYLLKNNIGSVVMMTRAALPHLQKTHGVVLAAGSESGLIGLANNTVYGGTKGFIHAFIRGLAVEQAKNGVRANCVCPGPIDTAWTHKETGPMTAKMEKGLVAGTPMGRRGTPEEVANVYAFLASDEASYVTGALWYVDGGTTVSKGPDGEEVPASLKKEPTGELTLRHARDGHTRIRPSAKLPK